MACLCIPHPHKGEAALSFGGKLSFGKQMRLCYLLGAGLDNEDQSSDKRASHYEYEQMKFFVSLLRASFNKTLL